MEWPELEGWEVGVQGLVIAVPAWGALAALLGVIHGALFHLVFGKGVGQLPVHLALGLTASLAGGLLGTMIPPAVLAIGDTNLISTGLCAWGALAIARLLRFC